MLINGSGHPSRASLSVDLRLRAIAENINTSSVEELWVFPPLPDREVASEFIVLVCYDGGDDRRRIVTAHMDAERSDPDGFEVQWVQRLRDHGSAPCRWVSGMPDRLLQRLSDAGVPEILEVGGDAEAWERAVSRFAERAGNGSGVVAGPAKNGNGGVGANGNAGQSASSLGAALVDSAARREIGFDTVIESAS